MSKVKRTAKMRTDCPNCSAIWGVGSEEWEWQQCDACGWPENDDEDDEYNSGYDNDLDDDFDWNEEEKNPNDSRNI